ncbi:MAG: 2-phospho-L-lactate guanylyltransferase [Candidatus Rokubacteria bacterium 13_1_40CM_69_27]|nr:MAG: 2-phospho-L-lactate guanylyltransferase [Candidatus Rokubacteria bacterium 13_1_40CM_69_27]OLE38224.1 MAG: 2-phospho-L-lactate guanylyltransferase [Candidatus Rokubacteria bacterium 13_1_20CM_2_70_7]
MIVAAVPVKDLANAKQRLVLVLEPEERAELARAMLRDVLRALTGARLDHVWVVTREAGVTAIAREFGVETLSEAENRGHTAAVALAQTTAAERGARAFLTVPGDVPCVSAGEIEALGALVAERAPAVVLVPSRSGLGTNGVALTPPAAMPLTFGEPSFDNHLAAARRRGLAPRVLSLAGLGLDVDSADDLRALLREGAHTESGRLLARWPIAARLAAGGLERRLRRRNPVLGEASEGAAQAPSD